MKRQYRVWLLRLAYWPFKAIGFSIALVVVPIVSGYSRGRRRWLSFSRWATAEDEE